MPTINYKEKHKQESSKYLDDLEYSEVHHFIAQKEKNIIPRDIRTSRDYRL